MPVKEERDVNILYTEACHSVFTCPCEKAFFWDVALLNKYFSPLEIGKNW